MNTGHHLRRLGVYLVGAMVLLALVGPQLAPYDPDEWVAAPFLPPSSEHWLGTDDMGQDLWSALLYGTRHSVLIALLAGGGATVLGSLIGAGAGYLRNGWDLLAMRLIDLQLMLPTLALVLVVVFYAGPSLTLLIVVLIISLWAHCARELRPQAAVLREADFVVAERTMGASEGMILVRYIIPVLAPLVWAQFTRLVHDAVLLESALSFLGLGDPQWSSWGKTLYYANARAAFLGEAWLWWVLPPGAAIALLVLGFALLGVGSPRGAALAIAMVPRVPAPARYDQNAVLEVKDLQVSYSGSHGSQAVLRGLCLQIKPGERLGLSGTSGAGKSTLVHTLLGLLSPDTRLERGAAWMAGVELLRLPERTRRQWRGAGMAWIPQAAMQSLNPVRTIGAQLQEVARLAGHDRNEARRLVGHVLVQVDLTINLLRSYPHELSGGMRQRVVIAMALLRRPQLLLADEPSSGLDRATEEAILILMVRLCREQRMALLLISHDLGLLAAHCDRLAILDDGHILESGPTQNVVTTPQSAAGRLLVAAAQLPSSLPPRTGESGPPVLVFRDVCFHYSSEAGLQRLNLEVRAGECMGLVGPSGAGKSTVAKLALGLLRPMQGEVQLLGQDLSRLRGAVLRRRRQQAHLIFQDPFTALPFHRRVGAIVAEPLRLSGVGRQARQEAALVALRDAGLPPHAYADRYVDSLSGGERQRVALARALIGHPRVVVADEPTSMLDAPAKWAWLKSLAVLQRQRGLAVLLITHDLDQARVLCDRIAVLEKGALVGIFSAEALVLQERAAHPDLDYRALGIVPEY